MKSNRHYRITYKIAIIATLLACLLLTGCGAISNATPFTSAEEKTAGPEYQLPQGTPVSKYNPDAAVGPKVAKIDTSSATLGYVGASATSSERLKFQVKKDDEIYNYDLANDGTPEFFPINMGNGLYSFHIMQNVSGTNYVQIATTSSSVSLQTEFEPFLHPNIFCEFTAQSACVEQARTLAKNAKNEGEVVKNVYNWLVSEIKYDKAKASKLSNTTGYIPNPDKTLETRSGICFDYASLAGAMFRSLGIPCQIVTGYVSPDNIYHAWNMIYINGEWVSAHLRVNPNEWTRIDVTFAAGGADLDYIGDGTMYHQRYIY